MSFGKLSVGDAVGAYFDADNAYALEVERVLVIKDGDVHVIVQDAYRLVLVEGWV